LHLETRNILAISAKSIPLKKEMKKNAARASILDRPGIDQEFLDRPGIFWPKGGSILPFQIKDGFI
jgi:hypothetical protein